MIPRAVMARPQLPSAQAEEPVRVIANCAIAKNGILICTRLDDSDGNSGFEWHISANHILVDVGQND